MAENAKTAFQGITKGGAFDIPGDIARQWLKHPNPNGRQSAEVVRPWRNGMDVTQRSADKWIVDFAEFSEVDASLFEIPFAHLAEQLKSQRAELQGLVPKVPTWREWIEQQAQLGDEAAISALRGMIYQDGRDAKKAAADGRGADRTEDMAATIRPSHDAETDPRVHSMQNLTWKVAKNGRVDYLFESGEAVFSDDGDRLAFNRPIVTDEALMISLQYAKEKWGEMLRLTCGDPAFKERVLRMAIPNGIRITNPELQALQSQLQAFHALANPPLRDQSYEDMMSLILGRNRMATFRQPGAVNRAFAGPIVGENSRYIAQHLGLNEYVIHDKSAIAFPVPMHGKSISIAYRNGIATLHPRTARNGVGRSS